MISISGSRIFSRDPPKMSAKGEGKEKEADNIFHAILFDDIDTVERLMDASSNNYIFHIRREDQLKRYWLGGELTLTTQIPSVRRCTTWKGENCVTVVEVCCLQYRTKGCRRMDAAVCCLSQWPQRYSYCPVSKIENF